MLVDDVASLRHAMVIGDSVPGVVLTVAFRRT